MSRLARRALVTACGVAIIGGVVGTGASAATAAPAPAAPASAVQIQSLDQAVPNSTKMDMDWLKDNNQYKLDVVDKGAEDGGAVYFSHNDDKDIDSAKEFGPAKNYVTNSGQYQFASKAGWGCKFFVKFAVKKKIGGLDTTVGYVKLHFRDPNTGHNELWFDSPEYTAAAKDLNVAFETEARIDRDGQHPKSSFKFKVVSNLKK